MRSETEVLDHLIEWSEVQANVRAALLTSSRANPHVVPDLFSDYDVELFVTDLTPFATNDKWLSAFGSILARWPATPTSFDEGWITRLVLFSDEVRIDFQIGTVDALEHFTDGSKLDSGYDNGYRVLLDKDGRMQGATQPSYAGFVVERPAMEEFDDVVHEFWWDVTYVAKSLWRDELYFAKYMLDSLIRFSYMEKMIEWYIGVKHDWTANPNKHGRWFKRYLDDRTWSEVKALFAAGGTEENWDALFKSVELFRRLAADVAKALDFDYPAELDRSVTEYLRRARQLDAVQ